MKKKLLLFSAFALLSLLVQAQICAGGFFINQNTVYIDEATNSAVIIPTQCDPCILGQAGADICNCRGRCQSDREACNQQCISTYTSPVQLQALGECLDNCYAAYLSCLNTCGEPPAPLRQVLGYAYVIEVYHSPVPNGPGDITDPLQGPPSQTIVSQIITASSLPQSINVALEEDWTEIIGEENYCIVTFLRIFYDDNTCCDFADLFCEIIG
jgi:hypothetical protein